MIAGAGSTIAGAELSIGGGGEAEGHPKSIQIDTNEWVNYFLVRPLVQKSHMKNKQ